MVDAWDAANMRFTGGDRRGGLAEMWRIVNNDSGTVVPMGLSVGGPEPEEPLQSGRDGGD